MAAKLRVKIVRGVTPTRKHEQVARSLVRSGPLREHLGKADHRLLSFNLLEPPRKTAKPQERTRYRAVYYDYSANRAVLAEGDLDNPERAKVEISAHQPLPSQEEFQAAVEIVRSDKTLGAALKDGTLVAYEPMPPLVEQQQADGSIERTLTVGLQPGTKSNGRRHEIVGVNMIRRRIERFEGGAPATARAAAGLCGVPLAAGQATTAQGVAGQVWIEVYQGSTLLWRFLAVRPSASSGTDGSGVELRYVDYRGKRVLYQAHVPVLNVLYDGNACGPYRDWQYEEGMIRATGRNVGPGFRLCTTPAKTILDTEDDHGNYLGTAIYVDGQEVVLVAEMEAGWYRYVSEWRLHADGTIRPRFGFDGTSNSCICNKHHHHVYWRFDFDIRTPGNNVAHEFNDPPIVPGHHWHRFDYEIKRYRDPSHKRYWRVGHAPSGGAYDVVPGENDGTAAGDNYGRGDVWLLRWHANQIDDYPRTTNTRVQIDKYLNAESLVNQDIVMWYGAHFTHDVRGPHVDHIVGPSLVPHGW